MISLRKTGVAALVANCLFEQPIRLRFIKALLRPEFQNGARVAAGAEIYFSWPTKTPSMQDNALKNYRFCEQEESGIRKPRSYEARNSFGHKTKGSQPGLECSGNTLPVESLWAVTATG
jgi:hypothetical protein